MKKNANRLLVIDDEAEICNLFSSVAEQLGFEVRTTGEADEFISLNRDFNPTVVILDLHMPQADGVEVLRRLANDKCRAGILVVSGADRRVLGSAERLGANRGLNMLGAMQKPVQLQELRGKLGDAKLAQRKFTPADLEQAIAKEQLLVLFLPKVAVHDNGGWSVEGSEALVRWDHPELGILMPDEFIPMAEDTGLIKPLTGFVLNETVEQLRRWHDLGLDLNVAVNVAAQLLEDLEFPDQVSKVLAQHDVEGSKLILEITESAAMGDRQTSMDVLTRLRLKGIELAIDDFGTGYSSLRQLFYMPFSELKIDASFVLEVAESNEARTMVEAMVTLAHNLGMSACCEGVETQEIWDFVASINCDKVQGFLISRPIDSDSLVKLVREWQDAGSTRKIFDVASGKRSRSVAMTE
jgi:EAL domain-containing protein (putative c-di-GMP-specific phosphodiesterase class I)